MVKTKIKFGSIEVGALKSRSIEPLVVSEPLGLIWSICEIEKFKNHINDSKLVFNINLVLNSNLFGKKLIYIKKLLSLFMVRGIFNFLDRPN